MVEKTSLGTPGIGYVMDAPADHTYMFKPKLPNPNILLDHSITVISMLPQLKLLFAFKVPVCRLVFYATLLTIRFVLSLLLMLDIKTYTKAPFLNANIFF